ncbi:GPP34 family phosphoprotein [Streptomyces griseus]|uniref:GOLPH3/VPS74 family protein n=1 Tax=Streptomyces griseus TaxID=1911 RepID=UPI000561B7BC|nr:GPP34 family phosphoprotein [Streptomyces griseus]
MTTAQDLMIVSLDVTPVRPVGQGDLSLALAGAELIDLVEAEALSVEDDRIVPRLPPTPDDHLLAEAASSLVRVQPYESVEDWLWRRGRGLSSAYAARMEADGLITRSRRRVLAVRSDRTEPADSPVRQHAGERWASDEPVLAVLAATVGLREEPADGFSAPLTDTAETVLAAVGDAVAELEAVRQRRTIEKQAFDNIWRGA